jgi:hypothetical protein
MEPNPYQSPQSNQDQPQRKFYRPTHGEWAILLGLIAFVVCFIGGFCLFAWLYGSAAGYRRPTIP